MSALGSGALLAVLLSSAAPPAVTVDEIVAKHVAARGGREALRGLKTVRMTGHADAGPGRTAIVRREIARPDRIRTELVFQGTTGVYAWDGKAGWRVSPLDGSLEAQALPPDEALGTAEQADLEGPLVDWKAKGHKVELVGTSPVAGGGPAHELKISLKSGGTRLVWIDAASGQMVRSEASRRVRGHEITVETTYGDFRKVGALSFPHAIEAGVRGRPRRLKIVVESVDLNPPLDEARFKMPR
jgi:hypothetical protein